MTNAVTHDIGFAIRDALEMHDEFRTYEMCGPDEARDYDEVGEFSVPHVDVSDPDNLRVHLSNGQVFTVRIIAGTA